MRDQANVATPAPLPRSAAQGQSSAARVQSAGSRIPSSRAAAQDEFDPYCDPEHPIIVGFDEILKAASMIQDAVVKTPCDKSRLAGVTDMDIYLKKEFLQETGSFKERGARYAMLMMTEEQRRKGVVAASTGNHAQAVCYHGYQLGIPITVVMPVIAPIMKVQKCRDYKANVIIFGQDMTEAKTHAMAYAREHDQLFLNGYDHQHIIAGQGTIGLEVIEQVPNFDAIVIPVGGAGLIAGIAVAIKSSNPNIKVIAVESERSAGFANSLDNGEPTYTPIESTLADGLAVSLIGYNSFATCKNLIDKSIRVQEEWIATAILRYVEKEKCVVEGAGAITLAAVLGGHLDEFKGKRVVLVMSGGNIDTTILGRALERGLAADGRLVKCRVTVSDRPGGISDLCQAIASMGINIKDVAHERAWLASDVFSVEVKVVCETRDKEHTLELQNMLLSKYQRIRLDSIQYDAPS